jgi:hypothetical protein
MFVVVLIAIGGLLVFVLLLSVGRVRSLMGRGALLAVIFGYAMLGFGAAMGSFAAGLVGVAISFLGVVIFRLALRADRSAHAGNEQR